VDSIVFNLVKIRSKLQWRHICRQEFLFDTVLPKIGEA